MWIKIIWISRNILTNYIILIIFKINSLWAKIFSHILYYHYNGQKKIEINRSWYYFIDRTTKEGFVVDIITLVVLCYLMVFATICSNYWEVKSFLNFSTGCLKNRNFASFEYFFFKILQCLNFLLKLPHLSYYTRNRLKNLENSSLSLKAKK